MKMNTKWRQPKKWKDDPKKEDDPKTEDENDLEINVTYKEEKCVGIRVFCSESRFLTPLCWYIFCLYSGQLFQQPSFHSKCDSKWVAKTTMNPKIEWNYFNLFTRAFKNRGCKWKVDKPLYIWADFWCFSIQYNSNITRIWDNMQNSNLLNSNSPLHCLRLIICNHTLVFASLHKDKHKIYIKTGTLSASRFFGGKFTRPTTQRKSLTRFSVVDYFFLLCILLELSNFRPRPWLDFFLTPVTRRRRTTKYTKYPTKKFTFVIKAR